MIGNQISPESETFFKTSSVYAIASYRVNSLTPYIGFSNVKANASELFTGDPMLDDAVSTYRAGNFADQHSWIFGARWDFQEKMALKVQWDSIRGLPSSVWTFQNVSSGQMGNDNVLSLSLDFIF